jgi:hypothetical protein
VFLLLVAYDKSFLLAFLFLLVSLLMLAFLHLLASLLLFAFLHPAVVDVIPMARVPLLPSLSYS